MSGRHKMIEVNGKSRYRCHRGTLATAQKGVLVDPIEKFGKWGYFCGAQGGGWRATPCNCTEYTDIKK
jgi:hypothetical protein